MRCTVCYLEFEPDDAQKLDRREKVQCPFCFSIIDAADAEGMSDAESDAASDDDHVVDNIVHEWGIDEITACNIVDSGMQSQLDKFMFITCEGLVYGAKDLNELKKIMLGYLLEDQGVLADIEYIFVDGERKDLELDVNFTPHSEDLISEEELAALHQSMGMV